MPDDLAVDNRALLAALRTAAERAGVTFVAAAAEVVLDDGARVVGVRCVAGRAGHGARGRHRARRRRGALGRAAPGAARAGPAGEGGDPAAGALRPGAFPPPRRTVRALVDGRPVYLVPRADGLVVGATQSEVGFDTTVTVGGVRDLLRDAERVLPGIAEYALVETAAGLRPGSPDNLPLIGALGPDGPARRHRPPPQRDAARPVTADAVAGPAAR